MERARRKLAQRGTGTLNPRCAAGRSTARCRPRRPPFTDNPAGPPTGHAQGKPARRLPTTVPISSRTRLLPALTVPHHNRSNSRRCGHLTGVSGAPGRIRTSDLRFRKPLLYPLSYGSGYGARRGAKLAGTVRTVLMGQVTGSHALPPCPSRPSLCQTERSPNRVRCIGPRGGLIVGGSEDVLVAVDTDERGRWERSTHDPTHHERWTVLRRLARTQRGIRANRSAHGDQRATWTPYPPATSDEATWANPASSSAETSAAPPSCGLWAVGCGLWAVG